MNRSGQQVGEFSENEVCVEAVWASGSPRLCKYKIESAGEDDDDDEVDSVSVDCWLVWRVHIIFFTLGKDG